MIKEEQAREIDLDIADATVLEIRTLTGTDTDDLNGTHGDWCEARLIR
jgi:hypothetical protein